MLVFGILLALFAHAAGAFADDNSDLANVYYQSGLALLKQSKYDEAAEKFNKALSYWRDFAPALCKLGECCEKTGDTRSAIKNYRLGIRGLEDNLEPTNAEKEILQAARRNLAKIDEAGNEAGKIKDKYISGLSGIANDCIARKYLFLGSMIYKQILKVDPNNKAALDGLEKVNSGAQKRTTSGKAYTLFNGSDLKGLVIPSVWLKLWTVDKSCLVFNAKSSGEPSLIQWTKPPPKNYAFSVEMFLEKRITANNYEISFAYGESRTSGAVSVVTNQRAQCTFNRLGTWAKVRFIVKDAQFKVEEGGKITRSGKMDPYNTPVIGIYAQGYIARFRNLTIETPE
ncbi:MAG: hypothetical protein HZA49_00635 [Planctomycetes bacterium]|nr:hypothetical protein [Planctomycetota bacterium]